MSSRLKSALCEYRGMLKATELEEGIDLLLFRPFAFLLVKLVQPTAITANQITLISLFQGIFAAACFWQGTPMWFAIGAGFLFLTNVFDCADGMLARLRGSSSVIGYLLDGMVDYVTHIGSFVGILHGLTVYSGDMKLVWFVGVPAGISFAWSCAMVDRSRTEWQEKAYSKRRDPEKELKVLNIHTRRWKRDGSHLPERALVFFYSLYVRLWYSGPSTYQSGENVGISTENWKKARLPVLRMSLLMGPSMHLFLIVLAGLFNRLDIYLYIALFFGTTWGLLVILVRALADRKSIPDSSGGTGH